MCGLAGELGSQASAVSVTAMAEALCHRGPDGSGQWEDSPGGIAMAHRRLAVLDLSPAGHQPMHSPSGRYVLAFNGEIYNHHRLRDRLAGAGLAPNWRGHSDTETLAACVDAWGLAAALPVLEGMFALAVWDRERRCLLLARDRFGEKPLYLFRHERGLAFASEIGALQRHPAWRGHIDTAGVAAYFRYGHVPGTETVYEGVTRLAPGHWLEVDGATQTAGEPRAFWSLGSMVAARMPRRGANTGALVDELEQRLDEAVGERMLSDVPLGVLLSGGIDSSAIAAAAQAGSATPVRTFAVGFDDAEHDESAFAAEVAAHLGTAHTELRLHPDEALDFIPHIPEVWGEPFADASQIPTALISRKAREHVTVCLAGDGGDELFGGYTRYTAGVALWRGTRWLPGRARRAVARAIRRRAAGSGGASVRAVGSRLSRVGERAGKLATCLEARDPDELYRRLITTCEDPARLGLDAGEAGGAPWWGAIPGGLDARERMIFRDTVGYLPDDLLVKTDRASMASSLEARLPFLDSRLVAFAWEVPMRYKIRRGKGKWLLRQLVNRRLPKRLMNRPKQGFTVPVGQWLRGPLRPWAEELLDRDRLHQEGWLDPVVVRDLWQRHLAGAAGGEQQLWTMLMFQAWLDRYGSGAGNVSCPDTSMVSPAS